MELSASLSESVTVKPFRDKSDTWEIAVLLPEPEARNRVRMPHLCWRAFMARFFLVLSGRLSDRCFPPREVLNITYKENAK